jgi:DNA-directed RNA polymerase subunit M/transcription elongation factor TFIIS
MRITCPECGAGLRSPGDGFAVGQVVQCPKCESQFEVEQPVAARTTALSPAKTRALSKKTGRLSPDDEDEPPRKKKKKKKQAGDEDDWSYKNSWIRYAVLGALLVILAVLAYFLYLKKKKERDDNAAAPVPAAVVRSA